MCADSRVPTATLYWYYVLVASSDLRRPFAHVFVARSYRHCYGAPFRWPFITLLWVRRYSMNLFIAALLIHKETSFVDRRPSLTFIRRSSTSAYPYFVDRRPLISLISSFVDLSVFFRRRRMWQSTMYSPRYLLFDPHTYSSKPSFVVFFIDSRKYIILSAAIT